MTERWQYVEKLCQSALELEESRRAAFLEEACGSDEELRREVESLLRFDKRGERFIEQPAVEVAAKMIAHEKPKSFVGQQLGSYEILSLLGAGGMGMVYKARDTRLNRPVAIKVLPSDRVSDPERKRRFVQEARAASALNHPNIITLHDIGSESGMDFIVMEYVAGRTLDRLIPRKGMRLHEVLKLAVPMADALAKAHSAGIIHRDLKPSNLMVTDDGVVKVLDFGLAKLTGVGSEGETRTLESLTEEGMIVGTVSYMSPEQAEGKKLDARSDIFSFGSVLYEMVSGQKAFQGDSKLSTLSAILKQEPKPISQRVPSMPPDLEKIINRCLRKDPGRRFHHMEDLKVELQELNEQSDSDKVAGTPRAVRPSRQPWVWAGAAMVVAAIAATAWFFRGNDKKPAAPPEVIPLTTYAGSELSPSFSPDGNQVAFSWDGEKQDNFDIYVKQIGSATAERLTTDPAEDISPAFSPDGRSIGFFRTSKGRATFVLIPAIGGPERPVAEVPAPRLRLPASFVERAFAWLPDGKWVVIEGLALLSTETGEQRSLTSPPSHLSPDYSPAVSPDGRSVAFCRQSFLADSNIYLLGLTEDLKPKGEPRQLSFVKGNNATWTPNGQEIVFASGALWRVRISGDGEPEPLSITGGQLDCPTISQSGNRLAYQENVSSHGDIWRLPLSGPGAASGPPTRLIFTTRGEHTAQYSPDSRRIAFESDRSGNHGVWLSDADGTHAVELFLQAGVDSGTARWSPDGQRVAFDSNLNGNFDIHVIHANGGKPIRLTTDPAEDISPSWSRDGHWVYFGSKRTGRWEVWKVGAGGGEARQVTRNGGETAFESPDGQSLYYTKEFSWPVSVASSGLWKMPVSGGQESLVLPFVAQRGFCVVAEGVYFIPEPGADRRSSIQFLSFVTGKVKVVAPASVFGEISVSPDGRFLLFSQLDDAGSDLMLVENFR